MSSRRNLRAAGRWILPAVIFVAAGSTPPLHAQSEPAPVPEAAPSESVVAPEAAPDSAAPAPVAAPEPAPQSGAVFDAPGMPGVRMMAPIPDASSAPVIQHVPSAAHETIVPGAQQTVLPASPETPAAIVPASITPPPTAPAPTTTGSVFDAPNMPGVRMMAPIPDNQPVVTSPTAVSTPIPTPRPSPTFDGEPGASGSDGHRGEERRVDARDEPRGSDRQPPCAVVRRVALSERRRHRRDLRPTERIPECAPELAAARRYAHECRRSDAGRYRSQAGGRMVRRPRAAHADGHDPARRSASRLRQPRTRNRTDPQGVVRGLL